MAPIYCKVCKLVFHQKRIEHNASEMHRLINDFLNPRCSVCDTDYFSPMAYERHIATLQHVRVGNNCKDALAISNVCKDNNHYYIQYCTLISPHHLNSGAPRVTLTRRTKTCSRWSRRWTTSTSTWTIS